ncbi:MAG: TetR/AcrR family transcriptional regulator [Anaerolineae bacterium]
MAEQKLDRRVQRTRALLNSALMILVREKGYDNVTIEDITERANLGRTTFYLHYQSKDDLFLDHHSNFASHTTMDKISRNQLIGVDPMPELADFLEQMEGGKEMILTIFNSKDRNIIFHNVIAQVKDNLGASLEQAFPGCVANLPLDYLTHYLAISQISIVEWWLKNRTGYDPAEVAKMLQACMASIVRDAYGVQK